MTDELVLNSLVGWAAGQAIALVIVLILIWRLKARKHARAEDQPMSRRLRLLRAWLCYRAILLLPVQMNSRLYCWLLGWAGWYAHGARQVEQELQAK